jgi:hypothetical protein
VNLGSRTYLILPKRQVVEAWMDQIDGLTGIGALSDDGEQDDGEGSGDDLNGWKAATTRSAGRLKVEGCVRR